MVESLLKHKSDMLVVEGIECGFTLTPYTDQVRGAQQSELVRDGGLAHPEYFRYITDAEFVFQQRAHDTDARGIPKYLKQFCEGKQGVKVRHMFGRFAD
jgi:hypothetical protein